MVLVLRSNGRWLETHPSHEVTCGRHEDNFSSHPLRYLWVNDYRGNSISGRDHYIFCSSVMLGTACTA